MFRHNVLAEKEDPRKSSDEENSEVCDKLGLFANIIETLNDLSRSASIPGNLSTQIIPTLGP